MEMQKGARTEQMHFFLTEKEREAVEEKMQQAGISSMSAYLRKMAIDGYVLRMELPEIKEMISLMRYSSNNLNQIAKKANETGTVSSGEIKEIQDGQERLWSGINRILRKLREVP